MHDLLSSLQLIEMRIMLGQLSRRDPNVEENIRLSDQI